LVRAIFDLHRLRLLRELHLRGTMAAVASSMSFSPSAVAQQIHVLEREVGLPLIEPAGRGVRLTAQGRVLVEHAEQILRLVEEAEADVAASWSEARGLVRIAAFQTAALALMPQLFRHLAEQHPLISAELTQGEDSDTLPALASGQFDLALIEEYPGHPGRQPGDLDVEDLLQDRMWIAVPEGVADSVDPARAILPQLADIGWSMEVPGSPPRAWVTGLCRSAGFEPRVVCTSSDMSVHREMVRAGQSAAVLSDLALTGPTATVGATAGRAVSGIRLYSTRHDLPTDVRRVFTAVRSSAVRDPAVTAVRDGLRTIVAH